MSKGRVGGQVWPATIAPSEPAVRIGAVADAEVEGPRQLVEALHRRYAGILYGVCWRVLRNKQEAEDAVQETFLNAYRSLSECPRNVEHLPWLVVIATNASLRILRSQRRHPLADEARAPAVHTPEPDQASALAWRRALLSVLREVDERSLQIMICHHLHGMTQGEVAAALGVSRRAVVKRLTGMRNIAASVLQTESLDE